MFPQTKNHQELVKELSDIMRKFLPRQGTPLDMESTSDTHIFSRGDAKALCNVKLHSHGMYNIEFVFQFWVSKLREHGSNLHPVFILSNNGATTTLKGFLTETRNHSREFGDCLTMAANVDLEKNASVMISKGSFRAFKQTELYSSDLNMFQTITVLRAHITDRRTSLQFIIMQAEDASRIHDIMRDVINQIPPCPMRNDTPQTPSRRQPIKYRCPPHHTDPVVPAAQVDVRSTQAKKPLSTGLGQVSKKTCRILTSWQWWCGVSMIILTALCLKHML
ncbi:BFRF1 [Phascolarctid gammaherpesvirus 1]|uniref:BFRF1 n=1 Tax=Phascolarctid gammaherpesvirus 1 TaxID=2249313 RepID=A0A3S8D7V0_9GAMA|nr:BFRF1 [Phascolarctid gammaherpesvirus 1]AZB49239.1 BFRF1 [Phascolarctid gammaherpesvirus 1]